MPIITSVSFKCMVHGLQKRGFQVGFSYEKENCECKTDESKPWVTFDLIIKVTHSPTHTHAHTFPLHKKIPVLEYLIQKLAWNTNLSLSHLWNTP